MHILICLECSIFSITQTCFPSLPLVIIQYCESFRDREVTCPTSNRHRMSVWKAEQSEGIISITRLSWPSLACICTFAYMFHLFMVISCRLRPKFRKVPFLWDGKNRRIIHLEFISLLGIKRDFKSSTKRKIIFISFHASS